MNDSKILAALEQFGATFPWDKVAIWLERAPAGEIAFTAYVYSDHDRGLSSAIGYGESIEQAMRMCRADAGERNPEQAREKAIRELKERLKTLEAAQFGPPPYRPGYHLAPGALNLSIDVESTKEGAPF